MTAVGKQRIVRRALIPDNLSWEIYDKPSKPRPAASGSGGTTPVTPDPGTGGGGSGDNGGGGDDGGGDAD